MANRSRFRAGSGYGGSEYTFDASTVAVPYGNTIYQYATGADGSGYYSTYDGSSVDGLVDLAEPAGQYRI